MDTDATHDPTLNELIDHYQREKDNPYAEKRCKSAEAIRSHLRPTRSLWGEMRLSEFTKGAKQRVKLQVEEWRRGGLAANTWVVGQFGVMGTRRRKPASVTVVR